MNLKSVLGYYLLEIQYDPLSNVEDFITRVKFNLIKYKYRLSLLEINNYTYACKRNANYFHHT